ncbi:MAG: hypothetical protein KBB01_04500 [Candidatus Omnitrophica bacterium]|jgi:hypothetical protein|nr:hypothetical protein [Candidatus Omnitrophota bacterium]
MEEQNKNFFDPKILRETLEKLGGNPYHKFNIAFALMNVIPMLVFFYLLITKLFNIDILATHIGFILFVVIVISLGGYYVGYRMIKNFLDQVVTYLLRVTQYNEQLKNSLAEAFSSISVDSQA